MLSSTFFHTHSPASQTAQDALTIRRFTLLEALSHIFLAMGKHPVHPLGNFAGGGDHRIAQRRLMIIGGTFAAAALVLIALEFPWFVQVGVFATLGFGFYLLHGSIQVHVHYTRFLHATGPACLSDGPGGWADSSPNADHQFDGVE